LDICVYLINLSFTLLHALELELTRSSGHYDDIEVHEHLPLLYGRLYCHITICLFSLNNELSCCCYRLPELAVESTTLNTSKTTSRAYLPQLICIQLNGLLLLCFVFFGVVRQAGGTTHTHIPSGS